MSARFLCIAFVAPKSLISPLIVSAVGIALILRFISWIAFAFSSNSILELWASTRAFSPPQESGQPIHASESLEFLERLRIPGLMSLRT